MAYYILTLTFEKYLHKRKFWNFLKIIFKLLIFKELKMEKNLNRGNVLASACPSRQILQHLDRKSTRLNSSHIQKSRMPSSA